MNDEISTSAHNAPVLASRMLAIATFVSLVACHLPQGPDSGGLHSAATVASAETAGLVACGRDTCDLEAEFCVGCRHLDGTLDTHCASLDDGAPFFDEPGDHGFCDYGSLEIHCDGNDA